MRMRGGVRRMLLLAGILLAWGAWGAVHSADTTPDGVISLSELLRVVQFFNSGGYHCAPGTEDGYDVGAGETACVPHSSDYFPQDWHVSLSELLRLIQIFNLGPYRTDPAEEDGFAPGSTLDPHLFPVPDDASGSFLTPAEETALGFDPLNPDEDGDGVPDGIELALALTAELDSLPLYVFPTESLPTDHVYLLLDGEPECYCLDPFSLVPIYPATYSVVNPLLGVQFPLPEAARTFMRHGSFSYYLDEAGAGPKCRKQEDECYLGGPVYRLDIPELVRTVRASR